MATERLDKIIASRCNLSRKEARLAVRAGEASVAGNRVTDPGFAVAPDAAVTFRGQALPTEPYRYLVMNKPKGVICASSDRRARTVLDLVPDGLRRKDLFSVGRLDKDTTGLLILTNDGAFAHEVLSPKKEIYKTYFAVLDGEVTDRTVQDFLSGVTLADGTVCRPAVLQPTEKNSAYVKICEGRYHQVKRMFGAAGLGVNELKRVAIGEFTLPEDLREGECKAVDKRVLESLFFAKKTVSVHID